MLVHANRAPHPSVERDSASSGVYRIDIDTDVITFKPGLTMRHPSIALAVFVTSLLLAGCGSDTTAASPQLTGEEGLPQPDAAGGSVTGMPNPGAPSVPPPPSDHMTIDSEQPDGEFDDGGFVTPTVPENPPATSTTGSNGDIVNLPPETMPTMPAPTPDPVEVRIAPPAES